MATFVTGEFISVEGLSAMVKDLRGLDKKLPKIVARANKKLTERIMLPEARKRWSAQNIRPSVASKVIKVSGTVTGAGIRLRSDSGGPFPYAAGVEFGAKQWPQFRSWRGNRFTVAPGTSTGYVVQDAIRDNLSRFQERWLAEVHKEIDKAISGKSA